jgi:multiple sugar transport system ATP-binding protein
MVAIDVANLRRRYGAYQALDDVSLTVADREFVVLLGPSGCGKTTLLRAIAGLDRVDGGRIHLGGRDVTDLPARARGLAMVFQNYAVFPHMTVFENVAFGLRMRKAPDAEVRRQVGEAAALLRIEPYLERYPAALSGGQRQRVALARALAVRPAVLLMDEPLSNLDAMLRLEMRGELKGVLAQSATTTLYVTHDQVEAMGLADRIAVMRQGRIVQFDRPMAIYADPADRFVAGFIGNPPMNLVQTRRVDGRITLGGRQLDGPDGEAPLLGLRAEEVGLCAPTEGIAAVVRVVEPLGPSQLVSLTVDEQLVRIDVANDRSLAPGDHVGLAPRPAGLRWFDATTGDRVGP